MVVKGCVEATLDVTLQILLIRVQRFLEKTSSLSRATPTIDIPAGSVKLGRMSAGKFDREVNPSYLENDRLSPEF